MRVAFLTGITGQDGSYLAEMLLDKGYFVHGMVRRTSLVFTHARIDHIRDKLCLTYGDLTDTCGLRTALTEMTTKHAEAEVFEIYNLGAQSHVQVSFEVPSYTTAVDAVGTLNLLDTITKMPGDIRSRVRFYQAGTSEMFGDVLQTPQDENTPFNPCSPYACAKVYAHNIVRTYREAYGLFACNGILFNHESPRRGSNFVTKKITDAVRRIKGGDETPLVLGNLDSLRDWGHAKDYVRGMFLILQHAEPDDFVLASGQQISVREFAGRAFREAGLEITWEGNGVNERGVCNGRTVVRVDAKYFRPCEVRTLLGNSQKARGVLGWEPSFSLDDLIKDMISGE